MMRKRLIFLVFLGFCFIGQSIMGCSAEMSPWIRKVLGERVAICYGYGEKGEFFHLQFHGINNARLQELGNKIVEGTLSGGYWSCNIGSSRQHVLRKAGSPLAKRLVAESSQADDEEWEYSRFILLFKQGRLVDLRPKGTEQLEFVWRETYIPN